MINISIVLYKTPQKEVLSLLKSLTCISELNTIFIIDNSPYPSDSYSGDKIKYIFTGENIGYGAGHNLAIKQSIQDMVKYHLVMNYDIQLTNTTISSIFNRMENDLEIGLYMPQILNKNGSVQLSPKLLPTPSYVIISAFKPLRYIFKRQYNEYTLKEHLKKTLNIPIISGCFSFFRVEVFDKIGLYDEDFFMYFEDDDISRRVYTSFKTLYDPELSIVHSHNRGATKNFKLFFSFTNSAIKYFNKWGWFFDGERKRINKKILKSL